MTKVAPLSKEYKKQLEKQDKKEAILKQMPKAKDEEVIANKIKEANNIKQPIAKIDKTRIEQLPLERIVAPTEDERIYKRFKNTITKTYLPVYENMPQQIITEEKDWRNIEFSKRDYDKQLVLEDISEDTKTLSKLVSEKLKINWDDQSIEWDDIENIRENLNKEYVKMQNKWSSKKGETPHQKELTQQYENLIYGLNSLIHIQNNNGAKNIK